MKISSLIILIFIINIDLVFSRDFAYPMMENNRSIGIFQPFIYTINNKIELSSHPILFFIKPNIKYKIFHGEKNKIGIASRYSFDYPTHFLRFIQHRGNFAFISEDPTIGKIDQMFIFHAEILASKIFLNNNFTGKIGISSCVGCNMDSRHIIDYDLVYPRMAIYHYGFGANIGFDWDYTFTKQLILKVDIDLLMLPKERIFYEHKTLFKYKLSDKYTINIGYKFTYGHYPPNMEGENWWNIFPLMDLTWTWKK